MRLSSGADCDSNVPCVHLRAQLGFTKNAAIDKWLLLVCWLVGWFDFEGQVCVRMTFSSDVRENNTETKVGKGG